MKQNKNLNQSFQEEVKGSGSSPPVSASSSYKEFYCGATSEVGPEELWEDD